MRWSQTFIPTLREAPADAETAAQRLLLRAGYFRQVATGIFAHLFLGEKSLAKISRIVREELIQMGGQEIALPVLTPAEDWTEDGQGLDHGEFKLRDSSQRRLLLGAGHALAMAQLARGELRSYKQLPQFWYQIQPGFRDDPRGRGGIQSLRQFGSMTACSFDLDAAGLDESYQRHEAAFSRTLERCGLKYLEAAAYSPGGDKISGQFCAPCEAGEDLVARCDCGYAAPIELAEAKSPPEKDIEGENSPDPFDTPGVKTIDDLARFTGESARRMIKTLVFVAKGQPIVLLLRGDHTLSEAKLGAIVGTDDFRPALPEEALALHGANLGSLGPLGLTGAQVVADRALEGRRNLIAGANRDDVHLRNVTPGRDFTADFRDIRVAEAGDLCLRCGNHLRAVTTLSLGRIAKAGDIFSGAVRAGVLNQSGQEVPLQMGSYEIELERVLMAAVEQNHDADGMFLPRPIAPFEVILTVAQMDDAKVRAAAEKVYVDLQAQFCDVLFDDRPERAGVKFKDADLIGVPIRVTFGKRKMEQGLVEIFERSTKRTEDVRLESVVHSLKEKYLR